jgi:alpha-galactosidase
MAAGKIGTGWKIEASTDRSKVLPGSDYVINTIEVSGVDTVRFDNDIPLKYGVTQCIGDTIGPGGIFKALRTVPAWLGILDDVKRTAPRAMVLNYTNPMSIITLCGIRHSGLPILGLCHSVQGSSRGLADYLEIPYEELTWECGGINHNAWFIRLEKDGEDMYPELRRRFVENRERFERDLVRMETMMQLGYYVTESSGHFSEYVPWFRKRQELIDEYCRAEYSGGTSFYADSWPGWRKNGDEHRRKIIRGEEEIKGLDQRSHEFASVIIEAHATNNPVVIYGNVINNGCIPNLHEDGCVEVACMIDKRGIHPTYLGPIPEQCAALNRAHMAVHELMAESLVNNKREPAVRALMLDPHTASVCSLAEIRSMFDELWEAEKEFMPPGME